MTLAELIEALGGKLAQGSRDFVVQGVNSSKPISRDSGLRVLPNFSRQPRMQAEYIQPPSSAKMCNLAKM